MGVFISVGLIVGIDVKAGVGLIAGIGVKAGVKVGVFATLVITVTIGAAKVELGVAVAAGSGPWLQAASPIIITKIAAVRSTD